MFLSEPPYVLTESKIDAVKPNVSIVASGSYTGNETANRAIPHGLGVIPKMVLISNDVQGWYQAIFTDIVAYVQSAANNNLGVTAPDATNFYVGNATEYNHSANGTAGSWSWVAFA